MIEGVAGHGVDQADVRPAGHVLLAQHDAAQVVLADQGDAAPVPGADLGRSRALTGPGVAAQDDQARGFAAGVHRLTVAARSAPGPPARCRPRMAGLALA